MSKNDNNWKVGLEAAILLRERNSSLVYWILVLLDGTLVIDMEIDVR